MIQRKENTRTVEKIEEYQQEFQPPVNEKIKAMAEGTDPNCMYFPVTELPSKFLPYPKGVSIQFRRYGWMEVKFVSKAGGNLSEDDRLQVAMEGIDVHGMDKYDLTVPDFLYIELLRKLSTTNPPYFDIGYNCPYCKQQSSFSIRPTDLEFEDLNVEKLPVTAKLSVGDMKFTPLTVRMQEQLKMMTVPNAFIDAAFMAIQCVSHSFEQAYKIIVQQCNAQDLQILEYIDVLFNHGLKEVPITCRNQIPTYKIIGGKTYDDLWELYKSEDTEKHKVLEQMMTERNFQRVDKTTLIESDVLAFLEEAGYVSYSPCNHKIELALDGGEGFLLPFRIDRADVVNAVSFGD